MLYEKDNYKQIANVLRNSISELEYEAWRRGLNTNGQYVIDVDQIEFVGEEPVALIDLKTWPRYVSDGYWVTVIENAKKSFTTKQYVRLAQLMGIGAYYVFINWNTSDVVVIRLGTYDIRHWTLEKYEQWLRSLSGNQPSN